MNNRQLAIDVLPLIQAVANGKQLQYLNNEWDDIELTGGIFVNPELYRIKPEQKHRPFENTKECWEEMQKHQPFGWVKCKDRDTYSICGLVYNDLNFEHSFEEYTFADGTPFGVKVME